MLRDMTLVVLLVGFALANSQLSGFRSEGAHSARDRQPEKLKFAIRTEPVIMQQRQVPDYEDISDLLPVEAVEEEQVWAWMQEEVVEEQPLQEANDFHAPIPVSIYGEEVDLSLQTMELEREEEEQRKMEAIFKDCVRAMEELDIFSDQLTEKIDTPEQQVAGLEEAFEMTDYKYGDD